jgi:large subunit ribosomal protein L19
MDSRITKEHYQLKKNVPAIGPGDRVKVHQKIKEGAKERIQIFEGVIIKTQHGTGINGTFTVRRIASGVGVEKLFPLHSPAIVKIEKIRSAKVRRAKLYYVRDLVGRAARRLKKEKEDVAVWEDVIVEVTQKDPEQVQIEKEAEETPEETVELVEEKIEEAEEEVPAEEAPETPEAEVEVKDEAEAESVDDKDAPEKK